MCPVWRLLQHDGGSADIWREVFAGSGVLAAARFDTLHLRGHRIGLRLLSPQGEVARESGPAKLRTK
jgi:hypothetical protein